MPSSTSEVCDQWLSGELTAFQHRTDHAGGSLDALSALQHKLLQRIDAGLIDQAMSLLTNVPLTAEQQPAFRMDVLLPLVQVIEQQWQSDQRSYDATLYAFWNLQRVIQGLSGTQASHQPKPASHGTSLRILVATAPGCEHRFGALVVSDLFRAQGWQVETSIESNAQALIHALEARTFDVLALSVGHDEALAGLPDLMQQCRTSSSNPRLRVMLGGNVFTHSLTQYDWLAADAIVTSAQHALAQCVAWFPKHFH